MFGSLGGGGLGRQMKGKKTEDFSLFSSPSPKAFPSPPLQTSNQSRVKILVPTKELILIP